MDNAPAPTQVACQDKDIVAQDQLINGIVSHSRCGKSTTVNLIMRFYEVSDGQILIDNTDVRAYRYFPVSRPHEFIALWTGATALEHKEIGMIRDMSALTPESLATVDLELKKRYFVHYIDEIYSIKENKDNIGYLLWSVKTDKGDIQFITRRWDRRVVVEGSKKGRIIFDIDENRYEIVNIERLDAASRAAFLAHIFW